MNKFIVGIPTLNRYDLLDKCIESIFQNNIIPEEVIVCDNGRGYSSKLSKVKVVQPHKNLGVSGAWNLIQKIADPLDVIICNDDILFPSDALSKIMNINADLILACGFSCFKLSHQAYSKVGPFDEKFFPAYFEDNDYAYRCILNLVKREDISVNIKHSGSSTIARLNVQDRSQFDGQFNGCRAYYASKWGGLPDAEKFLTPFNGLGAETNNIESIEAFRGILYAKACIIHSDFNEHCPTIYELAKECEHVTEMGTSQGNSTIALLHAQPKKLVCINQDMPNMLKSMEAVKEKTDLVFLKRSPLDGDIEETDMYFTDTQHTYGQLMSELLLHSKNVRKYIVIHDTVTFGQTGENNEKGMWPAITDFLESKKFKIKKHYANNHGLTVLERNTT